MGNSLNEVLPFLLQMVIFQEFQISIFGNDGVTRKIRNAQFSERSGEIGGVGKSGTHEMTKSEMAPNPRFHTTGICRC